jgi:hypothetical protein
MLFQSGKKDEPLFSRQNSIDLENRDLQQDCRDFSQENKSSQETHASKFGGWSRGDSFVTVSEIGKSAPNSNQSTFRRRQSITAPGTPLYMNI